MVRIATPEDLEIILSLSSKFLEASPYSSKGDLEKIRQLVLSFIEGDARDKIIFLYEDCGLLAASTTEFLFGKGKIAAEVAWWVNPERRKSDIGTKLLEAFEYWAKLVGCQSVTMACLDDGISKFYESKGYRLLEKAYSKEI